MGLLGCCWNLITRLLLFTSIFLLILPNLPDNLFPGFPLDPISHQVSDTERFFAKVKWNTLIGDKALPVLKGKIVGPESLVSRGNKIYTGLGDGRIISINKETLEVKTIAAPRSQDAKGCGDNIIKNTTQCGRPLGLRFGDDGKLYFVDAVKGLHLLDLDSGLIKHIALGPDSKISPYKGIFNDLVLDPHNPELAYVSVSTTRWPMDGIIWSILEMRKDGEILAVNLKTGKASKILTGFPFPNGLEVSSDKRFLLVAVLGESRIIKLDLGEIAEAVKSGEQVKNVQVLIDNLPGMPDNIRLFGNDLYIGLPIVQLNATIIDNLSNLPKVRKTVGRLANLADRLITLITEKIYPHPKLSQLAVQIRNGHILHHALPLPSGVLIVDSNTGTPKRILGSSSYPSISEALLDTNNGDIYLGSYRAEYLLRIKAKDLK